MNNKKGVDAIVATVLIIMITVAAVAIVWMTVIPMIRDTANQGITQFNAQKSIEVVKESYTCASSIDSTDNSSVQIARDSSTDVNLTKVKVYWIAGGTSVNTTTCPAPSVNGKIVCGIKMDEVAGDANLTAVKVAPIIQVGNAEKEFDALPEVALAACASTA